MKANLVFLVLLDRAASAALAMMHDYKVGSGRSSISNMTSAFGDAAASVVGGVGGAASAVGGVGSGMLGVGSGMLKAVGGKGM